LFKEKATVLLHFLHLLLEAGATSDESNTLINAAYDSKKFQDRGKGPATPSNSNGYGKKDNRYCTFCFATSQVTLLTHAIGSMASHLTMARNKPL
jgi:hypothetical protein